MNARTALAALVFLGACSSKKDAPPPPPTGSAAVAPLLPHDDDRKPSDEEPPLPATGADTEVSAGTACLGGNPVTRDLVLELATGKIVVIVEQPQTTAARATVTLGSKALTIRGPGCNGTEPL